MRSSPIAVLDADTAVVNICRSIAGQKFWRGGVRAVFALTSHPCWHMMMAYDSSQTPPSRLTDATIDAVRAALRAYLSNSESSAVLQGALLSMASEARAKSMLPEQLLVVLKDLWNGLPEVRATSDTQEQTRLMQRVVTMCIKEYYSA